MEKIDYKFNEDAVLEYLKNYIDKTYAAHYAQGKIQATEFIFDSGHGRGFCMGNVMKYAQRYGKKEGARPSGLIEDYSLRYNAIWKRTYNSNRWR